MLKCADLYGVVQKDPAWILQIPHSCLAFGKRSRGSLPTTPSPPVCLLFSGVRVGSLGLFLQCVISIFFSTIMDRLVKQFGTRAVYLASVAFFPLVPFVICFSQSILVVTVSAALTGFTFSALQILPYTLASLYHHDKQVGATSGGKGG